MTRLATSLVCLAAACSAQPSHDLPALPTSAPLVGVPGASDSADRACHVVLRHISRVPNDMGGYVTDDEQHEWIWEGVIDVSLSAEGEGALPSLQYQFGSDPTWWEVFGESSDDDAPDGFHRYTIRLEDHLPGPGMSGTALANARIKVIPLLRLPEGGRLFDHNRRPGDFDVYDLVLANFWTITDDAAACPAGSAPLPPPTPPPAPPPYRTTLDFLADFSESVSGPLVAGGELEVRYALERLPVCRPTHNGYPAWDIRAHARFVPGGEHAEQSVRFFEGAGGVPTGPPQMLPAVFAVPLGTTSIELWFENTGLFCTTQWDSNFGANYVHTVQAPPAWLGDTVAHVTRDSTSACEGGVPVGDVVAYDTWVRQRATVRNLCFQGWQPGVTDIADSQLWQKLDARAHATFVGATDTVTAGVPLDGQVGNNARWAFDLRGLDPFAPFTCPPVVPGTADAQGLVHLDLDVFFTVNGTELRPAGTGTAYRVRFSDYASDPWRAANCAP